MAKKFIVKQNYMKPNGLNTKINTGYRENTYADALNRALEIERGTMQDMNYGPCEIYYGGRAAELQGFEVRFDREQGCFFNV